MSLIPTQISEDNFPKCEMIIKEGVCDERAITRFGNGKDQKWMCGGCRIKWDNKIHKLKEDIWLQE